MSHEKVSGMKYQYQAVTGAGVWGNPGTLADAKSRVKALRSKWPSAEVERIAIAGAIGRRYWRFRSGKWSLDFWTDPSPADLEKWN